jgi:tetratricopeptide (TPR) repeat protein
VFKGTYDGLTSNFDWFENQYLYDIFKPDVSAQASVKIITDYYERLSKKMGYRQIAPEQGTSELIDYLNFKKWFDKALAFAELNYQNYPTSERAAFQFQLAKWNTKKNIAELYPQKTAKWIYQVAKKEFNKKDPQYNLSEESINTFGYELITKQQLQDALLIFKLNVELYPQSYNVYDSYGECLLLLGQVKEGIAAYEKSLELNPQNTNAKIVISKYKN